MAGVASGVGKTTIATGLMAALHRRGIEVANAKVGPDFIDPGYHALATGRPPRNLDPWLCGADHLPGLAGRAGDGADLLVIEGVMGLFDGADDGSPSSTADLAALLDAPVVLVVDASAMSSSVAAIVRGFRDHDERVRLGGVICNRVGSDRHEALLRQAIGPLGVPVVGCLRRDDAFEWRDRHLGLVPVAERATAVSRSIDRLAHAVERDLDLAAIESIAREAPRLDVAHPPMPAHVGPCRIAVAGGAAFTFSYADNVEALRAAGAEIVPLDPRRDPTLPDGIGGLIVGGGFPEVFGEELSANVDLRSEVRSRIAAGLPTWAECGGLLWLAAALDDRPMVGALPVRAALGARLTLGYRTVRTRRDSVIGPEGTRFRGHEFHYSTCDPPGEALALDAAHRSGREGFATPTLLATYVHHHAGGDTSLIEHFVGAVVSSSS
ncbi:MAG: cobyrinate a,c-diamide synthase [Actinomycetota bacterium]